MAVKHGILGLLADRPRHGYELRQEFDLLTGGLWELNIGQIYSTLERMVKDGLALREEGSGGGEERKVYSITALGLQQLQLWLDRPPLKPRPMRDELFVRLGLLTLREPAAALRLVESQRRLYHQQMAELTRQKIGLSRTSAGPERLRQEILLDAALLHTEADLRWLENCEARIEAFLQREQEANQP